MTDPNEKFSLTISHQTKQEVLALTIDPVKWTFLLKQLRLMKKQMTQQNARFEQQVFQQELLRKIEALRRKMQFNHSNLQDHVTPFKEEAVGAHAKPWQNEMDALHRDVRALHLDV
ncbi:hypothetical protein J1N35_018136 [Gossypium stocksii]|uniref:Uncharacterized protein n=1 Tax=Gossypium stocksii TaxID=47602 RepID=A0A9D4A5V8_9ROSI|nr:hypothetical protein J1N35_018136 [Gossypium stocksii]